MKAKELSLRDPADGQYDGVVKIDRAADAMNLFDGANPSGLSLSDLRSDAANVNAAGATMNSDTDVSSNSYVLDEDTLSSNSSTKLATQQSIKAYVDAGTFLDVSVKVQISASVSIPNNSFTTIDWDGTENYDTDTMHDADAAEDHKLTATTAGKYLVIASGRWTSNATGQRGMILAKFNSLDEAQDESQYFLIAPAAAFKLRHGTIGFFDMAAGDYVVAQLFQNSGGSLNFEATPHTYFAMHKIG